MHAGNYTQTCKVNNEPDLLIFRNLDFFFCMCSDDKFRSRNFVNWLMRVRRAGAKWLAVPVLGIPDNAVSNEVFCLPQSGTGVNGLCWELKIWRLRSDTLFSKVQKSSALKNVGLRPRKNENKIFFLITPASSRALKEVMITALYQNFLIRGDQKVLPI